MFTVGIKNFGRQNRGGESVNAAGLDIINLGLVYNVDIQDQGKKVDIDMTLTTPACPAGPQIIEQARHEIGALRDVYQDLEEVNINLVWSPFWNPSMMTEEAREELGFF